ncbi:MAG: PrsW family intramembrane metalloprotease [Solirubrobacterales bacterium]
MRGSLGGLAVAAIAVTGLLTAVEFGLSAEPVVLVLALALALLPVPLFIGLALWIDRYEPEPRALVLGTFLWGATVATFVAGIVNSVGTHIVGLSLGGDVGELYGGSISAPVVEEGVKALALLLVYRRVRHEFNGVVDGIVYALLVGIGFAMTENVIYYLQGAAEEGVVGAVGTFVVRGIVSPLAHPLFTAAFGIGLGIASRSPHALVRIAAPVTGLVVAVVLHSLWNTSAVTGTFGTVFVGFFVPALAAVALIVVLARRREGRTIRAELQHDVRAGTLTGSEVEGLASLAARKAAVQQAMNRGGEQAADLVRSYHHAASELAFFRLRARRGLGGRDGPAAGEGQRYETAVRVYRARLSEARAGGGW